MGEQNIAAMSQSDLWNGPAGQAWLHMQALLDSLFEPFEALLVDAVRWHGPHAVLDIGCGTGATTLAIARALAPHGSCTGADLSQMMIDRARQRAAQEADGVHANFRSGDASRLDGAGPFDMATSRFGVMFFDDPAAAFERIRAAMVPDAPLAAIAWRSPAENPFMTCAERAAAPLLPPLPPMQPGAPGQFAFADPEHVRAILDASGWRDVTLSPIDIACTMPEAGLMPYLSNLGRIGIALQQADAATRDHVFGIVRAAFDPFVDGDTVRFNAACWMIEARA
ncbi:class I SAM-dependent methyltransferase [Sphingomonas koreensis]|jgi:SAM-dependent methyltransferase|uniref:SAM-dependent methyltransferase n=1 Tax=Sphingomonas koreensis TaxID=93064 RepID=A0A1L6JDJ0_9SPHN|nr:class I SAM-dependent methyltransferase [Sphingomonas koreensis]APR54001.1 SAM-dependent methyltransferase [Sphingomonas koreensis]MDC7808967.1 methyltransferase domain-containing protein [Sphingomonas koreensis]RSU19068.1 class I SAM-dependent methyltransferase [Sphingomonas koreensis]RSU24144.1 class I SAM-dependent methyltransferase [Sphingomonas koreensis]RSU26395.1 class I SAM-dependent methyltransferase [Sphingomonas koreensis]